MLLSYRLKEQFEDALEVIKQAFEFITLFKLESVELEWLVTNWCKIKRDLWKIKIKSYQNITIADYLKIPDTFIENYLLQEIRTFNYFK